LLPNLIVDQHFSQRGRFERLRNAIQENPTQMGLGIDEATAVLITAEHLQVMGNGAAYLFGASSIPRGPLKNGPFASIRLEPGDVLQSVRPRE
jgi:cyanophycinase